MSRSKSSETKSLEGGREGGREGGVCVCELGIVRMFWGWYIERGGVGGGGREGGKGERHTLVLQGGKVRIYMGWSITRIVQVKFTIDKGRRKGSLRHSPLCCLLALLFSRSRRGGAKIRGAVGSVLNMLKESKTSISFKCGR